MKKELFAEVLSNINKAKDLFIVKHDGFYDMPDGSHVLLVNNIEETGGWLPVRYTDQWSMNDWLKDLINDVENGNKIVKAMKKYGC